MEFAPGHTVGIDLGTTFSAICYLDDQGNPTPIPNDDDEVETPSLILLASSGHVIVGPSRQRAAMEKSENVVERIKRWMGNAEFKRTFDGREITPEFISALILKKLRQDAEKRIGPIGNAVITVPAYFNDIRRKATQDSGRIAGLNVIDIINEPTAATLLYAWHRGEIGAKASENAKPRRVLVYDLGGGTFDVTVVQYTATQFNVLATDGDAQLGGIDWNDRILDFVAEEFKNRHGVDIRQSPETVHVLRHDCDRAKIQLSESPEATIVCRHEGKALQVKISREQFEEITADLLQRTLDTTELVIEAAKLTPNDLDAIVLVGGSTLMPIVPTKLQEVTGKEPYRGISPHTSVAQGAAIHAAILEAKHLGDKSEVAERVRRHLQKIQSRNVNSHALGISARDPRSGQLINHVMIPRNTPLPTEVRETFYNNAAAQTRVRVKVMEGDAPDPAACALLGDCCITDLPPNLQKGSPVEVTYAFEADGRVRVKAQDKTGGAWATIEIQRKGALDEAAIDRYTDRASQYKIE